MPKPFKFRYVNELAGVFVVLVVMVLVASVILAGRAQGWFEPRHELRINFGTGGSQGLITGSQVQMMGTTVGAVDRIEVSDDGHVEGVITVRGAFINFIREDSIAIIKKKLVVMGDAYIEITRGSQGAVPKKGSYIPYEKDTEILEQIESIVSQVEKTIDEITGIATDLRQITSRIKAGEGALGRLVSDPAVAEDVEDIINKIEKILEDVKQITAVVELESHDLKGLMVQTQNSLYEANKLIEGLQRHWLLRKYVEQAPAARKLISPVDISIRGSAQ